MQMTELNTLLNMTVNNGLPSYISRWNELVHNHISPSLHRVPPTEMHMVTSVNVILGFFVRNLGFNSYEHVLM